MLKPKAATQSRTLICILKSADAAARRQESAWNGRGDVGVIFLFLSPYTLSALPLVYNTITQDHIIPLKQSDENFIKMSQHLHSAQLHSLCTLLLMASYIYSG